MTEQDVELVARAVRPLIDKSFCPGTICACTGLCHKLKAEAVAKAALAAMPNKHEKALAVARGILVDLGADDLESPPEFSELRDGVLKTLSTIDEIVGK